MRVHIATLMIVPVLAACVPQGARPSYPAESAVDRLPLELCLLDGIEEPLLCGVLEVYEDRDAAAGRAIPIKVVVVPAQASRSTKTAWIEHPGGPRYSTVANARYFAVGGWLESFRRNRDIVLVDVRGLHESGPLYCEALKTPRILERYYPPERVRACREELDPQAELRHYSTRNAIDDYEDIREWLGYEQWDAGGWSFGARFMLTYVHRYPDSIRTIALFIPSILNFERPLDYARFGQQAFDGVVAACAGDEVCGERFPSTQADLDTVLARLEREPAEVEFIDPYTGEPTSRQLTRDLFAEGIWEALLDTESARELPYVLHQAARRDLEPFVRLAVPSSPREPEPEGHYLSVVCPEETGRLDRTRAGAAALGTFLGDYTARDYIGACDAWGLPLHPGHPVTPGRFDVPALIVTGELDPVTPPEYGERNAAHFEEAMHFTVPQMAHGESGMENSMCLTEILIKFVDRGTTEGLDTSCVETMRPPSFRID